MVGNHVADIVARYGETSDVPAALTEYIKGREGYDYNEHGQVGNVHTAFVPDDIVDQPLRGRRQHQPRQAADEHEHQAEPEPAAVGPHKLACLAPRVGGVYPLLRCGSAHGV